MGDLLKVRNNLLLTKNDLLSLCCCEEDNIYWEAVPCDAYELPGDSCRDPLICSLKNRVYVNSDSVCVGTSVKVCECQILKIPNYESIDSSNPEVASVALNLGWNNLSFDYSDGLMTISVTNVGNLITYNTSYDPSTYDTLADLLNAINNWSPDSLGNPITITLIDINPTSIGASFNDFSINLSVAGDAAYIPSLPSGIYLSWEGSKTIFIAHTLSSSTFKSAIETALRNITGLEDVVVYEDDNNGSSSEYWFYITFAGSQCGIRQDKLGLSFIWTDQGGLPTDPSITEGIYTNGFGLDGSEYTEIPDRNNLCPYDNANYQSISHPTEYGYKVFDENTQCCPQKGTLLGPNQNLPNTDIYRSDFANLENTITRSLSEGSSCYKLSPYFFLFGKEGRLSEDPNYTNNYFVMPDCLYGSGNTTCDNGLPCNCVPELFVTFFHPHLHWGPFGSYHQGIEEKVHPAYTKLLNGELSFGQNYAADNAYSGWRYAPSGRFRTVGTWNETTGLIVDFYYYQVTGYYVGTTSPSTLQDGVFGHLDLGTVGGGLNLASGIIPGHWQLSFATSGKSVQDFLNAINNVKTRAVSGITCNVFNFCAAASDIPLGLPASKINNLSSELYETWYLLKGDDETYRASDPHLDTFSFSASTIYPSPKRYDDLLDTSVNVFNSDAVSKIAVQPPVCRRTNQLPSGANGNTTYDYVARANCRPYWTTMRGCTDTILSVARKTDGFDDQVNRLDFQVSNTGIFVNAITGIGGIFTSGKINLDKNGSGYKVSDLLNDLNNMTFTKVLGGTYNPLAASTGTLEYDYYLDHSTWVDGGVPSDYGVGIQTSGNFSYKINLDDVPVTDIYANGLTLEAWLRSHCLATNPSTCFDGDLPRCIPSGAVRIDNNVNCEGDKVIDGNWLVTYGCNSYNCKTEWFIRAKRCSCTNIPACNPLDGPPVYVDHPVNREEAIDCSQLSQPTIYICENNIHPDCDIPFLVKVPYQFVCSQNSEECFFGNCWQTPLEAPCYVSACNVNGEPSTLQVGYSIPDFGCPINLFDLSWMNDGYDGWCQLIDPESPDKVRRQDIPREWPPVSYIMERSEEYICTTNINPFDLGDAYPKYDAIGPLWPVVPYEYIIPNGETNAGWPCFMANLIGNNLFAYIRPMVTNVNAADLCPDGQCGRIDIDCNTRCCYCGFSCADSGGQPCPTVGPRRNCQYDITLNSSVVYDGYQACRHQYPASFDGDIGACRVGLGCSCPAIPGALPQTLCLDGTNNTSTLTNITQHKSTSVVAGFGLSIDGLSCVPIYVGQDCCWQPEGQITTTTTLAGCAGTCWYLCSEPSERGCGGAADCLVTNTTPADCSMILTYNEYIDSSGLVASRNDCTLENCPDGCSLIARYYTETFVDESSVNTLTVCGDGTVTWDKIELVKLDGSSESGMTCGGSPQDLGIQAGAGYNNRDTCTCSTSSPGWIYRGQEQVVYSGTYTVSSLSCDSCSYNVATPKSYEYILNFVKNWACGLPQYNTTE